MLGLGLNLKTSALLLAALLDRHPTPLPAGQAYASYRGAFLTVGGRHLVLRTA